MNKKIFRCFLPALCMLLAFCLAVSPISVEAAETEAPGSYPLSARLSCYVNAMGGVEFGEPLVTGAVLNVEENGTQTITLHLSKSSVTIYSVTCDTFIDAAPGGTAEGASVENGTVGYYDAEGQLQTEGVIVTLSQDTALNPANEEVQYVDSITFPIESSDETYNLSMYVNSNVMGVQFGSVQNITENSGYLATLTVDWEGTGEALILETEAAAHEAEEMDGLSIYRAEAETEEPQQIVVTRTENTETPWLMIVLAAGLICGGAAIYIHGVRRKDDENA